MRLGHVLRDQHVAEGEIAAAFAAGGAVTGPERIALAQDWMREYARHRRSARGCPVGRVFHNGGMNRMPIVASLTPNQSGGGLRHVMTRQANLSGLRLMNTMALSIRRRHHVGIHGLTLD
jgi:hypothetical protein